MWSTSAIVALSAEVVVSGQFGLGYILVVYYTEAAKVCCILFTQLPL